MPLPARVTSNIIRVARRDKQGRLVMLEKVPVKPVRTNLRPSERRAQGTLMMVQRIFGGATVASIAEDFRVSNRTATSRLKQSREDGVPEQARAVFIEQMLPTSMAVLKEALEGEDMKLAVQVALKVVDGLAVMDPPKQANTQPEETLEIFRARITRAQPPAIDVETSTPEDAQAASPQGAEPVRLLTDGWSEGEVAEAAEAYQADSGETSSPPSIPDESTGDAPVDSEGE